MAGLDGAEPAPSTHHVKSAPITVREWRGNVVGGRKNTSTAWSVYKTWLRVHSTAAKPRFDAR
ncbi:hypothetical protein ISF_09809 [Cordyceps fumosorosea ARSEF 2679]|uniref:Uncharacterized protein n=1 Tax=Cordyceps fumosorosea (strain ARSEF 2679) TaxID=1081104 RepID=A0A162J7M7_CORFA|nr:hypothetical protein ISF_09809 [Cordyceps fumosorosea ARSEF 2679]OAA40558.1 hypothetical protein ISF_09809 [Cordyceps fumosorosea ARSEF 2679]